MSIFGTILAKIGLGGSSSDTAPAAAVSSADAPPADAPAADAPPASASPDAAAQAPAGPVDVAAVLDAKPGASGLNWRTSIVDLMKLCELDSSLAARKELADELGFDGDKDDSASMNIWLHKQVMQKLAENGGTVPSDLQA